MFMLYSNVKMSIADWHQKIKSIGTDTRQSLYVAVIIIAVAFSSFALGRLSISEKAEGGVQVLYPEEFVKRAEESLSGGGNRDVVVASKNGTKYHYPWCSGAVNIAEKNKITFSTIEEARNAGFTPAANCEGLK